jgi:hypothetical protein
MDPFVGATVIKKMHELQSKLAQKIPQIKSLIGIDGFERKNHRKTVLQKVDRKNQFIQTNINRKLVFMLICGAHPSTGNERIHRHIKKYIYLHIYTCMNVL